MSKILVTAAAAALLFVGPGAPSFAGDFNPLKIVKRAVDLGLDTAEQAVDLGLETAEDAIDVAEDAVTPDRPKPRLATDDKIAARDCHSGELYRDTAGEWQTCAATP